MTKGEISAVLSRQCSVNSQDALIFQYLVTISPISEEFYGTVISINVIHRILKISLRGSVIQNGLREIN